MGKCQFTQPSKIKGGVTINRNEMITIADSHIMPTVSELYGLEGHKISVVRAHQGGRNLVYSCEKSGTKTKMLRIICRNEKRRKEDVLAEMEYVRYLYDNGAAVSNVIDSQNGNLAEVIVHDGYTFFISLFEKANGKQFHENGYRYREGVSVNEYYYNCGKTLGKIHQLSKSYIPIHSRHNFTDSAFRFNAGYVHRLIPKSLPLLKEKMLELIDNMERLDKCRESFGMIHFDYNDGNYSVDFDTGHINVYDFDESCFYWYMFDLASVWISGVGWIQSEVDVHKRWEFMDKYFETVLTGYRTETGLSDSELNKLPLFIQVYQMDAILHGFEEMLDNGSKTESDGELAYHIKCLEEDIPFIGFFHEIFSCDKPFEYEIQKSMK